MTLSHVTAGDPHVDSHNAERDAINDVSDKIQALNVPSYAGKRKNPWDGTCGYNFKSSNLRRIRKMLGGVQSAARTIEYGSTIDNTSAGQGNLTPEILIFGDSLTATVTADNGSGLTWSNKFTWGAFLRKALLPDIAQSYKSSGLTRANLGGQLDVDSVFSAGWTAAGSLTTLYTVTQNAYWQVSSDTPNTCASIIYYDFADGATFDFWAGTIAAGNAGHVTITCSGPAGWKRYDMTNFPAQTVLNVMLTSAGGTKYLFPAAMGLWSPNKLLVHNLGQPSAAAAPYATTPERSWAPSQAYGVKNPFEIFLRNKLGASVNASDPHLVICELVTNDLALGLDHTTTKNSLRDLRNAVPNSDFVFVLANTFSTAFFPEANWFQAAVDMYDLADELDVPLFDCRALFGDYNQTVTDHIVTDGAGHMTFPGNAVIGRELARLISK